MGAGLGHDRAFRSSLSSAIRVHSFWRGIDRVSQPFGFGAVKQPSLGHPAFTEFSFYDAAPLGIRYLHIDSLGGCHRGRLRPRASLRMEAKSPERFSLARWTRRRSRVRRDSRN